MVEFFLVTGGFSTSGEVIEQLPDPIETEFTSYTDPAGLLKPFEEHFQLLLDVQQGAAPPYRVVDESGAEVDTTTAAMAIVDQRILSAELERINSVLCGPCGCTLCCVGPEQGMKQAFFEIPLQDKEPDLFSVERIDTDASRNCNAMDEPPLQDKGKDFFLRSSPALVHWQQGWSLVLPKTGNCPNLEVPTGRCTVYPERPQVCRKPQIFPYVLEPLPEDGGRTMRVRRSILAVMDCPYVQALQEEIAAYAAACELDILFKQNKE